MKKSELKTGMRVKLRNGDIYLVIKDVESSYGHQDIAFVSYDSGFMVGSSYNENLINKKTTPFSSNYDIVEVYLITDDSQLSTSFLNLNIKNLVWKREEYTKEQTEIFKAFKTLGFNWIARDENNEIYAYDLKPEKEDNYWFAEDDSATELCNDKILKNLKFIKWGEEPFEIPA